MKIIKQVIERYESCESYYVIAIEFADSLNMAVNYVESRIDEIVSENITALQNNNDDNYISVTRKIKDNGIKNPIFGICLASIIIRSPNQEDNYIEREINFYYCE